MNEKNKNIESLDEQSLIWTTSNIVGIIMPHYWLESEHILIRRPVFFLLFLGYFFIITRFMELNDVTKYKRISWPSIALNILNSFIFKKSSGKSRLFQVSRNGELKRSFTTPRFNIKSQKDIIEIYTNFYVQSVFTTQITVYNSVGRNYQSSKIGI